MQERVVFEFDLKLKLVIVLKEGSEVKQQVQG